MRNVSGYGLMIESVTLEGSVDGVLTKIGMSSTMVYVISRSYDQMHLKSSGASISDTMTKLVADHKRMVSQNSNLG